MALLPERQDETLRKTGAAGGVFAESGLPPGGPVDPPLRTTGSCLIVVSGNAHRPTLLASRV